MSIEVLILVLIDFMRTISASPFVGGGLMRSYSDFKVEILKMFSLSFKNCYNKNECGSSLNRIKSLSRYQPQENYITFCGNFAMRNFSAERTKIYEI